MNSIFNANSLSVLEQVVSFSQKRHHILAGNIANLDTPDYKVKDLNLTKFQEKLQSAIQAKNEPNEPLSPGLSASRQGDPIREVTRNMEGMLFHDQSNVGMEQQVAAMTKNQMMHNLALKFMENQIRLLETAISERV
ncbi:MAG: flagellar basal body rod protein FlgB [Pirellulales bacterium]|jgi:flagellar basal-body rod protein FlgB